MAFKKVLFINIYISLLLKSKFKRSDKIKSIIYKVSQNRGEMFTNVFDVGVNKEKALWIYFYFVFKIMKRINHKGFLE